MAQPAVSGENVLTALDQQRPTAMYWQLTLLATLGGFAALCVAAIAFIYWFLPETKGLPVEEIVTLFEKNRRAVR
jgi:hypothetical protein